MWSYYLYMGLLITTLLLWGIVAMKDDGYEEEQKKVDDNASKPGEG